MSLRQQELPRPIAQMIATCGEINNTEPVRLSCPTPSHAPLAPHSVNNDCMVVKHLRSLIALCTARHELPTWSLATLCGTPVWASPWQAWLLHPGYTGMTSAMLYEAMSLPHYSYVTAIATAAASGIGDRAAATPSQERINMSLQFLWLPASSSSLLAWALPTLDSAVRSVWTGLAIYYCLLLSLCARHWVKSFMFVI